MTPFTQTPEELVKELSSDSAKGLTADEVLARKEKYGINKLREKKKKITSSASLISSRM